MFRVSSINEDFPMKTQNESVRVHKDIFYKPSVAIIIPIYNRVYNIERCLDALLLNSYPTYTIIVVDDGSTDGSSELIQSNYPKVMLLKGDGNLWWAGATNKGIQWALENNFDYILTYNDDQVCDKNFLSELIRYGIIHPDSILSSVVYSYQEPKIILSAGMQFNKIKKLVWIMHEKIVDKCIYEVDAAPGYSMLIPTNVLKAIGLFDHKRFPQIYMEGEFCFRAKQYGTKIQYISTSKVFNDRIDKSKDPLQVTNPIKRLLWSLFNRKSVLEFSQNYNFWKSQLNFIGPRLLLHVIPFWSTYALRLIVVSFFKKDKREIIKGFLH